MTSNHIRCIGRIFVDFWTSTVYTVAVDGMQKGEYDMKITRKKLAKGTGGAFYALAAAVLVFYFRLSLDPMWTILPPGRVVLLLAACLLMYVGGRLIAGTLPASRRLIPAAGHVDAVRQLFRAG